MLTGSLSFRGGGASSAGPGCPAFPSRRCPGPTCFPLSQLRGRRARVGGGRGRTSLALREFGQRGRQKALCALGFSRCVALQLPAPQLCSQLAPAPRPPESPSLSGRHPGAPLLSTVSASEGWGRRPPFPRREVSGGGGRAALTRPHRRARLSVALGRQPSSSLSPSPQPSARRRGAARPASADWLRASGRRAAIGPRGCPARECARWGGGAGSCWKPGGRAA